MRRKMNPKERIQAALCVAVFGLMLGITGTMDYNDEKEIRHVDGIVQESMIIAESGEEFKVQGFADGMNVTLKLDRNGKILSVISK